MATKPTVDDARWATDETNNTAPSSGQKDTGWTDGQVAVSDYFNVLGFEAYKWFQYLSDGNFTGATDFSSGTFALSADISPAAITGGTDNYNPTGLSTAQIIRQDLSGDATLTGLAGGADGRLVMIVNLHATNVLKFSHQVTSSAANQFYLPGGRTYYIYGAGSCAIFQYDGTLSRWRLVGGTAKQVGAMVIAGCDFQPPAQTTDFTRGADGSLTHNTAASTGYNCALRLPVGAVLDSVSFDLFHGAGSSTRTYSVRRTELNTGYADASVSDNTSANDTDPDFSLSVLGTNHELAQGYSYSLRCLFQEVGDGIMAASVTYYVP
jgi:hypothetical protein